MDLDLQHLAQLSAWVYAVVFLVAFLDAMVPVVPSEGVIVAAAVLAAQGRSSPAAVLGAAALGALAGDGASYGVGRRTHRRRGELQGRRARRAVGWARGLLERHGPGTLIVARFVPGGRTATTFTAGFVGMAPLPFVAGVAAGAALWATQATAVGYLGGRVFEDNLVLALGLGLGSGLLVALAVELVRARLAGRAAVPPRPV